MGFLWFLTFTACFVASPTLAASSAHAVLRSLDTAPVVHFTLARRGGEFAATEPGRDLVNLTYLVEELDRAEARFNLTRREVKGNKLVRKVKINEVREKDEGALMGDVAADGVWCILY